MPYLSHTESETQEMLKTIGVTKVEDLFDAIPKKLLLKEDAFNLPPALSEQETRKKVTAVGKKNKNPEISFVGGGFYHHYIPSHVRHLAGRSEFYTAYTPYQPEMSQGILQSIFEYQSCITRLTAMDATNASMYDGSSAAGETCFMASNITKRKKILVARSVHPEYRKVMQTYSWAKGLELQEIPFKLKSGRVDAAALEKMLNGDIAGVFIQSPNFFGVIEDIMGLSKHIHDHEVLLIQVIAEALSLGILNPPGKTNVDIVVGEGQSFGLPISGGGPSFGFMAAKERHIRQLPGRIVGETEDRDGDKAYILTLQAREQHIRREKASSNICTNQALCALHAVIYLATLGKNLQKLALINHQNTLYMQKELTKKKSWKRTFSAPFFNEFVVEVGDPRKILKKLRQNGIAGGIDLGKEYPELKGKLLVCATEMTEEEDISRYIDSL